MTVPTAARSGSDRLHRERRGTGAGMRVAIVAAAAFLLGGLTSYGQLLLPPEFASLANSASGWAIPTAVLVYVSARGYAEAALGGAAAFVALTLGYAFTSAIRGIEFDPVTWAVIGAVTGPVVGAAAFAVRREVWPAVVGAGLLAGVLVGEGVYGLTVIADTTRPAYWWVVASLGASLLAVVAVRLRSVVPALAMLGIAATVAAGFLIAFTALPSLLAGL